MLRKILFYLNPRYPPRSSAKPNLRFAKFYKRHPTLHKILLYLQTL